MARPIDFTPFYRRSAELLGQISGKPQAIPKTSDGINWGLLFHLFSKEYGWTPEQVGNMTFDQIVMYLEQIASGQVAEIPSPNMPDTADVLDLCARLAKHAYKGKSLIQIAREFTKEKPSKDRKAKSLLRQARRYPHLWRRADS